VKFSSKNSSAIKALGAITKKKLQVAKISQRIFIAFDDSTQIVKGISKDSLNKGISELNRALGFL
jgi:hypothetical protein